MQPMQTNETNATNAANETNANQCISKPVRAHMGPGQGPGPQSDQLGPGPQLSVGTSHRKRAPKELNVIYRKLYVFLCLFKSHVLDPSKKTRIDEI